MNITITIIIDNNACGNFQSEHGLSLWIEYGDKRIVFDAGQSDKVLRNAEMLSVDFGDTDAIVISHGHYDHTGGLEEILNAALKATLYVHPQALMPRFSRKDNKARMIGIAEPVKRIIQDLAEKGRIVWTKMPTEIVPSVFVTGSIPRITGFENDELHFFTDEDCQKVDTLPDDQAMFFDTRKGLAVILGCAHSGVVNTLDYINEISGGKSIYAVAGGMHLLNASAERIKYTIEAVRGYNVQKIGLAHCTGKNAVEKFQAALPDRCFICSAGQRIKL